MPAPRRATDPLGSPVPAYSVSGVLGSMASESTAMLGSRSLKGAQVAPPSIVFHTPPPLDPAYITPGVVGWIASARVRPPTLPGPSAVQPPVACCRMAPLGCAG